MSQARDHRKFSPSRSEQFGACPGMPNLVERLGITRDESKYAIEGTKAHDIFATALQEGVRDARVAHAEFSSLCLEEFDDEFFASIQAALDHVYGIMDDWPGGELFIEVYVDPPCEAAPGETGGYVDVAYLHALFRVLYVMDYKHGAGIAKEALNNSQPMQYAGGFLFGEISPDDEPPFTLANSNIDDVIIQIIQPRAFHASGDDVREWRVTPYQIYEYITTALEDRVIAALDPNAPLIPGKAQCQFCEARTVCPAREAMVADALVPGATIVEPFTLPDVTTFSLERLGKLWEMKGAVKKFFEDVDDHIKELSRHGHTVPGTKVVEVDPRREWFGKPVEIAAQLAELTGEDASKFIVTKNIGITDAEKEVVRAFKSRVEGTAEKKAAATEAKMAMAQLTDKKSSGNLTVVSSDDPRRPVNRATAFSQIGSAAQQIAKQE